MCVLITVIYKLKMYKPHFRCHILINTEHRWLIKNLDKMIRVQNDLSLNNLKFIRLLSGIDTVLDR